MPYWHLDRMPCGRNELNGFAAYPAPHNNGRSKRHKPTIGLILCGSGFPAHFAFQVVYPSQSASRSTVNDGFEHVEHFVRSAFAKYFVHLRNKWAMIFP